MPQQAGFGGLYFDPASNLLAYNADDNCDMSTVIARIVNIPSHSKIHQI
jgi:hypothetical protein